MKVTIQPARPRDAAAIGAILAEWRAETPWLPRSQDAPGDRGHGAFLMSRCRVLVARGGPWRRRVLGFLAHREDEIDALYLAAGARGRGIGRALLEQVRTGRDRLGLWVFQDNRRARAFYARAGFVEAEFTDGSGNDDKLPDLRMIWSREFGEEKW